MNTLFNRQAYAIWGPVKEITSSLPFLTGGSVSGLNLIDASTFGWPFIDYFNPPEKDNKTASDLRIEFNIEKDFSKHKNKAEIKIYNLRSDKYLITEDENETQYKVYLFIGHGEAKHRLFVGDIECSSYEKIGPNWVFTIKANDCQSVTEETVLNKSYASGGSLKNALLDMLNTVGEKSKNAKKKFFVKNAVKWIGDNVSNTLKIGSGLAVTGKLIDQFEKLMKEIDAKISTQDDKIEIIWENSNNKNDIVLLSPNSGLIGSPKRKNNNYIEFKSLLIPIISPGGLVKIESRNINDYYRIEKINYVGDTHGRSWECRCDGIRPSNIDTTPSEIQYYEVQNNIATEDEATVIGNA